MSRRAWVAPAIVALLALAASVTSIGHDFTFDDRYVILFNDHVHALKDVWRLFGQTYWPKEQGGDGYRPLVTALFTVQWAAGGGAPWVFHLVNIVLAVAAALAVYWCASALLPAFAAGAAAALFAVHPVHVEVTGNVVGQSELLVAIFLCIAIGIYLRARRHGPLRGRDTAAVLLLYTLGLLCKEHAIVLPALLLAAEFTVVRGESWSSRLREHRVLALLFVAISLAFLLVVGLVHRDVTGFAPYPAFRFLHMTALDRAATMMTEMPRVARLLVYPAHLSGDYSPTDVLIAHGLDVAQLPGLIVCLGVLLLAFAFREKSPVASFGLFWVMIAYIPVSNLLVPTGFLVAERTLFFPSVGLVLVAGAIIHAARLYGRHREQRTMAVAVGVVLGLGLMRSIDRQRVWQNNDVFFDQLVLDAPNSYRAHFLRANVLGAEGRLRETSAEYHQAIRLFPYDVAMMLAIASEYHRSGACGPAIPMLTWSYAVEPTATPGRVAYVQCLAHEGRWADSRAAALDALRVVSGGEVRRLRRSIARADSALGRGYLHRDSVAIR